MASAMDFVYKPMNSALKAIFVIDEYKLALYYTEC